MKQERLPLRKGYYLFITFETHDGKQQRYFRTNKPINLEAMSDGQTAYHVVQCDIYSYCDYWLPLKYWTLTRIEDAKA